MIFQRTFKFYLLFALVVFSLSILTIGCATVNEQPLGERRRRIVAWNDIKWLNIERQMFDYSCGTGATATLLNGYFGDQTTEDEILNGILKNLSDEELMDRINNGLSLLDLKKQVQRMGYDAVGVYLTPRDLDKLRGPVLILLKDYERYHFTILKGIKDGRAYLADSARGNIRIPMFRFVEEWDGTALIFGKENFGLPEDHKLAIQ